MKPMCPHMSTDRGYCDLHKPKSIKDKTSDKYKADKFYNTTAWKKTRHRVLMLEPLCRICLDEQFYTEAEHVDHIIRKECVDNPHAMDNLMPLCRQCHSSKTNRESRYYQDGRYTGRGINPYEQYIPNRR